jgi:small subunit ribosomal protein S21
MKHLKFLARTVLVENNNIDLALQQLGRVLSSERIVQTAKHWETYEKPYQRRNRLSFEKSMEIYGNEMDRKIKFILRKNRESPHPWE